MTATLRLARVATVAAILVVVLVSLAASGPAFAATVPSNDDFSNPIFLLGTFDATGNHGEFAGDSTSATTEADEATMPSYVPHTNSVWLAFQVPDLFAPSGGTLTVDTAGSSFDTVLDVRPYGSTLAAVGSPLAFNDDVSAADPTSRIQITLPVDGAVIIGLYGHGSGGSYQVHFSFVPYPRPTNDDKASAELITGASGSTTGDTTYATLESGEMQSASGTSLGHSVWFLWTAPALGTVIFDTTGSAYDTFLDAGGFVNDDASPGVKTSQVHDALDVRPGDTVLVSLYGVGSAAGDYTLSWSMGPVYPLFNDNFADAQGIVNQAPPGQATVTVTFGLLQMDGATTEAGEPGSLPSVWYQWTAPANVTGSAFAAAVDQVVLPLPGRVGNTMAGVAAYTGNSVDHLTSVGATWLPRPETPGATWVPEPGVTYHIQLSGDVVYAALQFTFTVATDVTPPNITPVVSGTLGNNGWYTSDVSVVWNLNDPDSPISSSSGCATTTVTRDTDSSGMTLTCTATSAGGATTKSVTIKRDATPPSGVTTALNRGPDHTGWYTKTVGWTTTGADASSGIAFCSSGTYSGPDSSTALAAGTCTDSAGNTTPASASFRYDATPPPIAITAPRDGGVYVLGELAAASYGCGPDLVSGLVSCLGTLTSGATIDTGSVGPKSFTITATDNAGNTTAKTIAYTVQYAPQGKSCDGDAGHTILQPINTDGSSVFKQGSTVPATFRVCDANGVSIGTPGVVTDFRLVQTISGSTSTVNETVDATTPDTAFRWDATASEWVFNIATKALTANTTYVYRISLNDGSTIDFRFSLK